MSFVLAILIKQSKAQEIKKLGNKEWKILKGNTKRKGKNSCKKTKHFKRIILSLWVKKECIKEKEKHVRKAITPARKEKKLERKKL